MKESLRGMPKTGWLGADRGLVGELPYEGRIPAAEVVPFPV
jgi:hypothetical protein